MLISMTGYGEGVAGTDSASARVEIRSVNHRFLDIQVRLPRAHMRLESRVAGDVRRVHRRGRVEVTVQITRPAGLNKKVRIDTELAREYMLELIALKGELSLQGAVQLQHILSLDGVVTTAEAEQDPEADWPVVREALAHALVTALESRRAEGLAMARDIEARIDTIRQYHRTIVALSEPLREELETRLETRVTDLLQRVGGGDMDRGRLLQEVTYLVDRADVSEEIARLGSHLEQFSELLRHDGPHGKRMEFLLQEMVREVNTIGSKTSHDHVLRLVMLTKVELEKIREQAQNVE